MPVLRRRLRAVSTPGDLSTLIHRFAGRPGDYTALITTRPFPSHHTIPDVELIGGGHIPMPGEVSLVHHGMISLGALPELRHHVIESLRESIGKGFTTIEPLHR
jgi:magnesium chelatase family protein